MTRLRAIVCLAGVLGLLVLVPLVHRSPASTYGGADVRLLVLETGAAVALLVVAAWGAARVDSVLLAVVGACWLVPELAGGLGVPLVMRTALEIVDLALVVLLVWALALRNGQFGASALPSVLLVTAGAAVASVARLAWVDPHQQVDCWRTCERNPLLVGSGNAGPALQMIGTLAVAAGVLWAAWILQGGRLRPGHRLGANRDTSGWLLLVGLVASLFVQPGAVQSATEDRAAVAVFAVVQLAAWAWLAELGWQTWLRWHLESRLAKLVHVLGGSSEPEVLTESLRTAARDPDLRLGYWAGSRQTYVDATGHPTAKVQPRAGEQVTTVARRGEPVAVIVHSRRLDGQRLGRALGPALRLALENEQLRAAALAELDELSRSRARVVERGEVERRRLERNLHDGAQQRVVSLALMTRILARQVSPSDQPAVRRAEALARTLVEELRRVARGIYPAVLGDAGLIGAVVDLAERSDDLAVVVGEFPEGRHPGSVETTAYLLVRAAIADARSRGATSATITGTCADGALQVIVQDDAARAPDGLVDELADQVGALRGTLVTNGAPGRRRVEVVLPCGS
jgi:signal transduction histidine kinase